MHLHLPLAAAIAFVLAAPLPAAAGDVPCSAMQSLRSQNSDRPAKMTFINKTGEGRAILWIDFDGTPKDYAWLNPGERFNVDTFLTHPWMVADGPGNCIDIYMPRGAPRTVRLTAMPFFGGEGE